MNSTAALATVDDAEIVEDLTTAGLEEEAVEIALALAELRGLPSTKRPHATSRRRGAGNDPPKRGPSASG